MITHHAFASLGGANHGWLDTKHHFSFANYHNPKKMSFGELLVINDDTIAPYTGFDSHPHRDMEIITYVRQGAITHKDNQGNKGRTTAGNVQVMSAGTGIFHSEYNHEDEATKIYQIWIIPNKRSVAPRWDTAAFPSKPVVNGLPLLVSGDGKAPLQIHQDARIYAGRLTKGTTINHRISGQAYMLVSEGIIEADGKQIQAGDGAEIKGTTSMRLSAKEDGEMLIIEVPGKRRAR